MQIAYKDLPGATYYRNDAGSPLKTTPAVPDIVAAVGKNHLFSLYIFISDMTTGWVENNEAGQMVIVSDRSYHVNGKEIEAELRMTLSKRLYECLTKRH